MPPSPLYIVISVVSLAVVTVILLLTKRQKPEQKLSKFVALSFVFIIMGFFFGEVRLIGYCFFGIGALLAVADIVKKGKE